jgi:hypothetical protein
MNQERLTGVESGCCPPAFACARGPVDQARIGREQCDMAGANGVLAGPAIEFTPTRRSPWLGDSTDTM